MALITDVFFKSSIVLIFFDGCDDRHLNQKTVRRKKCKTSEN